MRLVHLTIRPKALHELQRFYDQDVIPALQKTDGCLYACLIQSVQQADECVSLTLWETPEHADRYVNGELFERLWNTVHEFLAESNEWKIQLTSDLKIDYLPVTEEPIVESHQVATMPAGSESPLHQSTLFYLRIFSMKVIADKREELTQLYHSDVIPALLGVPGCRYAYLTEGVRDKEEFFSITIWNSKADADAYEASPLFEELKNKIKHTFVHMIQWKMGLGGDRTVTSDDVAVKGYTFVTGRSFR